MTEYNPTPRVAEILDRAMHHVRSVQAVLKMMEGLARHSDVKELGDTDLALAVCHEIWGDMEFGTREEAILSEVIDRLMKGEPLPEGELDA